MLAPEEILSLHSVASASLQGRCDITRKTRVRQTNGSWKDTTTTLASNMPCRKVPTGQTPTEQAIMQTSLGARGIATFIVDGLIDVTRDDVLLYPSGPNAKSYGVAGVLDRSGGEYTRVVVYDDSKAIPA